MLAPPPVVTVTQWAEAERRLSAESSAEPGRYSVKRTPYTKAIMDAWNDPAVKEVVWMASAQVGKTTVLENILGYHVTCDPCPVMVVQPTLEMAETFSRDRVSAMIRDTPALSGLFAKEGSRQGANTLRHKRFFGGQLALSGANSAASLRSRPIRVLLLDEVDAYAGGIDEEGDPIGLATKRTTAFRNAKIGYFSTPATSSDSKIAPLFEASDQNHPYVACPQCGHRQVMHWEAVHWREGEAIAREDGTPLRHAVDAWIECVGCHAELREADRLNIIRDVEWRPHAEFRGRRGFWIWQGYSPFRALKDTVNEWLSALGNPAREQVFINTALARTYHLRGEAANWELLRARSESYPLGSVPMRGLLLTAGVDVQKDRLEVQVRAWSRGRENWLVDYQQIFGDPTSRKIWKDLDGYLNTRFLHESGIEMAITKTAIDTGYATQDVYAWARTRTDVIAIDPRSSGAALLGLPNYVDITIGGNRLKRGVRLWPVNVSKAKHELMAMLRMEPAGEGPQPGYAHHPVMPEEFWRQLVSEEWVIRRKKNGHTSGEWVKTRERNEALDTLVYARAAAEACRVATMTDSDWKAFEQFVAPTAPQPEVVVAPTPAPPRAPVPSGGYWGGPNRRVW